MVVVVSARRGDERLAATLRSLKEQAEPHKLVVVATDCADRARDTVDGVFADGGACRLLVPDAVLGRSRMLELACEEPDRPVVACSEGCVFGSDALASLAAEDGHGVVVGQAEWWPDLPSALRQRHAVRGDGALVAGAGATADGDAGGGEGGDSGTPSPDKGTGVVERGSVEGLRNKAVVIVAERNAKAYLGECLDSVFEQDYEDVGLVLVDDASDDGTAEFAEARLRDRADTVFVRNPEPRPKMANIMFAFRRFCRDPDSVIFLVDGDDRLVGRDAISAMMREHLAHDVVWSQMDSNNPDARDHNAGLLDGVPVRSGPFVMSHLKSFKAWLLRAVPDEALRDRDGRHFARSVDQAIMIPVAEMAGRGRCLFLDRALYWYRDHDRTMHAVDARENRRHDCAQQVRRKREQAPRFKVCTFGRAQAGDGRLELLCALPGRHQSCLVVVGGADERYVEQLAAMCCHLKVVDDLEEGFSEAVRADAVVQTCESPIPLRALLTAGVPLLVSERLGAAAESVKGAFRFARFDQLAESLQWVRENRESALSKAARFRPTVTVVVPCFDQARYLDRCLSSVARQTLGGVETIVVNDGSPDDCSDVVRAYRERTGHWVRLVEQPNRGLSGARNAGFSHAAADWVFPLDADDYIHPDALELCLRKTGDADVVYPDLMRLSKNRVEEQRIDRQRLAKINTLACSCLVAKDIWRRAGGYDQTLREGYEDWNFWLSCIEAGARFVRATGAVFCYDDTRSGSMVRRAIGQHERLAREVASRHERLYEQAGAGSLNVAASTVTVVVSAYNQRAELELALESLFHQLHSPLEVIVADDGSTDGTLDWLDDLGAGRYPFRVRYVTRRHASYRLASIHNLAASWASGDRFLFTNADQLHCPFSIRAHAALGAGKVGGGIFKGLRPEGVALVTEQTVRDFSSLDRLWSRSPSPRTNLSYIEHTDPNDDPIGVWGGNVSVPAALFREVGGFDAGYDCGWGGEENDLVRRMIERGAEVSWVLDSWIYHLDHPLRGYSRQMKGTRRYLDTWKAETVNKALRWRFPVQENKESGFPCPASTATESMK